MTTFVSLPRTTAAPTRGSAGRAYAADGSTSLWLIEGRSVEPESPPQREEEEREEGEGEETMASGQKGKP